MHGIQYQEGKLLKKKEEINVRGKRFSSTTEVRDASLQCTIETTKYSSNKNKWQSPSILEADKNSLALSNQDVLHTPGPFHGEK